MINIDINIYFLFNVFVIYLLKRQKELFHSDFRLPQFFHIKVYFSRYTVFFLEHIYSVKQARGVLINIYYLIFIILYSHCGDFDSEATQVPVIF